MTELEKKAALIEAGAVFEHRDDSNDDGKTKTGWWQDGVFLSKNTHFAYEALFA